MGKLKDSKKEFARNLLVSVLEQANEESFENFEF